MVVSICESCLKGKHTSKIDIQFPNKGIIDMKNNEKKWKIEYLESLPQQDSDKQEINQEST